MTQKLMTHLVANFPNKKAFFDALRAMFKNNVEFLEIQIPFSHPLADGPTIYDANQKAMPNFESIIKTFEEVSEIKKEFPETKTKLILMSYATPILNLGIQEIVKKMNEFEFFGFIIPDLTFGTSEQMELSKLCAKNNLEFVPVISPLTSKIRIKKIKPFLRDGQTIYATARTGKTGSQTNLDGVEISNYLEFLKENFEGFKLALGFGIKEKSQVEFLRKKEIIPVIGSQIVRIIDNSANKNLNTFEEVDQFLNSLI